MGDSTAVATAGPVLHPAAVGIALGVITLACGILGYRATTALAARGPDDKGVVTSWALLKSMPSTNLRIVIELALAAIYVVGCMIADTIGRPVSSATQDTMGLFIAAMLGIGAGQFFGKRKTDASYVAAKNSGPGNTSMTVNAEEATVSQTQEPTK